MKYSELTKCILGEVERGESTIDSLEKDAQWCEQSPNQCEREMGEGIREALALLQPQQSQQQ
jgi:hypothetical protein